MTARSSSTTVADTRAVVLAVAAHPDDIEFTMGGTLRLLVERGWEAHYLALCNGGTGSTDHSPEHTALLRASEAREAAAILGAVWHESLVNDLELTGSGDVVRRVTALVREIRPTIVLTQAPDDYMDDHVEASRVATSAAFNRAMPNYQSSPPRAAYPGDVTVYHAQPHGLHDGLRRLVFPGIYVDIGSVRQLKTDALAAHRSQAAWLRATQGFSAPTDEMLSLARTVGQMSGRYEWAEGWRRHSHLGFSAQDRDPLSDVLADVSMIDQEYERALRRHPGTGQVFPSGPE